MGAAPGPATSEQPFDVMAPTWPAAWDNVVEYFGGRGSRGARRQPWLLVPRISDGHVY